LRQLASLTALYKFSTLLTYCLIFIYRKVRHFAVIITVISRIVASGNSIRVMLQLAPSSDWHGNETQRVEMIMLSVCEGETAGAAAGRASYDV